MVGFSQEGNQCEKWLSLQYLWDPRGQVWFSIRTRELGTSLVVQWLNSVLPPQGVGGVGSIPGGGLRSPMLRGTTKKKKKKKRTGELELRVGRTQGYGRNGESSTYEI